MQAITLLLFWIIKPRWVVPFHNGIIFSFSVTHFQGLAQRLKCPRLPGRLKLSSSLEECLYSEELTWSHVSIWQTQTLDPQEKERDFSPSVSTGPQVQISII